MLHYLLSGLCQNNVALSRWWRIPVLQCIFKTARLYLKGRRRTWNPLPYYQPPSLLSMNILMVWGDLFFLALKSGFSQFLASFSLILNCVYTSCSLCLFPSSPSNSFSCGLPDLPLQYEGSVALECSAHQNFPICVYFSV